MSVINGFQVGSETLKYNYESLENYNTPEFSTSSNKTYTVGDYVMYNGKLYKCTIATTGGTWDVNNWEEAILTDDIEQVKNDNGIYYSLTNNGEYTIKSEDLVSGVWYYSVPTADTTRGRIKNLIPVRAGMLISYENTTYDTYFGVLETPTSSSYIQLFNWRTDEKGLLVISYDGYLVFNIRNHADSTVPVDISDYNSIVAIKTALGAETLHCIQPLSSFGLSDIPKNSYMQFDYPGTVFAEAPDDMSAGGYVIYRINAQYLYYTSYDLDILFLANLTNPKNIYVSSYASTRDTPFYGWIKLANKDDIQQYVTHNTVFSITDVPVNKYTSFVVPTDTFSDAPDDLKNGGYAIFRSQAYSTLGISIIWLYGLTNPEDIWFATYNTSRTPALSAWAKISTNPNFNGIEDALSSGDFMIDASNIEQGWWNWGRKSPSDSRIRTNRLIKVRSGTVVNYTVNSAFDIYIGIAPSVGATEWTQYLYWTQGDGTGQKFLVNFDGYLGIILRKHDGSTIVPSDYTSTISIANPASFPTLDKLTCKIFRRVVCCGDSYTAGYIRTTEQAGTPSVMTHEEYAWPHYMSTLTGNAWKNCGSSGATTISWQTEARGLPQAQALGKAQAYVIGLMINDVGTNVEVGTSADIGTDANTYYAQLSKIIRELHTINPDAIIFVNTCPRSDASFTLYNQAVRDIATAYYSTYHTHCVDLYNYRYLYTNISLTGDSLNGHFTASGYEQFAEIYAYILSDYINTHISDFQNVHKIPFDEDQNVTNVYDSLTNSGEYTISSADLESGQWSWSQKDDNSARARAKFLIPVYAGMSIAYQNTTFDTYFGVLPTPTSMEYYTGLSGWKTDGNGVFNITADGYLTFIIRNHANTSVTVDPADFNSVVTINTIQNNAIDQNAKAVADIQNMISTVEATTTASKNYAVGDVFIYAGNLYKVTISITAGDSIVPGTNCMQTTLISIIKGE